MARFRPISMAPDAGFSYGAGIFGGPRGQSCGIAVFCSVPLSFVGYEAIPPRCGAFDVSRTARPAVRRCG
jgi:hypothetical protein